MSWSKRTGERGLLTSLNLKTTEVEVLNLKSKECVNPFILYTNFSTCVHFSAAGISKLPTGTLNNVTHPLFTIRKSVHRDPEYTKSTRPGLVAEHPFAVDTERGQTGFQA